ncbi:hypothetical protein VNI00_000325 [Paramarasmius palmivorus]|uniref:BAH domain-containing protein n=1 Tax=Paramarasmius palmivorus TaxID=297713 RepID=A0AAW0EEX1_9AGAR
MSSSGTSTRKRKSRLPFTHKKHHKPKQVEPGDYPVPTEEDWKKMTVFARLQVYDEDDNVYVFKVGDCVTILPPNLPRSEGNLSPPLLDMWMARIEGIRQRGDDGEEVWLKARWFYTPEDVNKIVPNFDITLCGLYERILSSHMDFVHSSTLNEIIDIKHLVMSGNALLKQPRISTGDVYYRYNLDLSKRQVKPKLFESCGICRKSHAPLDSQYAVGESNDPNLTEMRICPRASCLKGFHTSCLLDKGYGKPLQAENDVELDGHILATHRALSVLGAHSRNAEGDDRDDYKYILRLLNALSRPEHHEIKQESNEKDDGTHETAEFDSTVQTPSTSTSAELPPSPPIPRFPFRQLPRTLLALAAQPLSRGSTPTESKSTMVNRLGQALWGFNEEEAPGNSQASSSMSARNARGSKSNIAGNVGVVFRARREVCDILEHAVVKAEQFDVDLGTATVPMKRKHDSTDDETKPGADEMEETWISRVLQETPGSGQRREGADENESAIEADLRLIVPYILHVPPSGLFSILGHEDQLVDMKGLVDGDRRNSWRQLFNSSGCNIDSGMSSENTWLNCPSCSGLI